MSTTDEVPELVSRALRHCLRTGWLETTRHETGRLLATLAASCRGTVAEASTGSGVGVAWLRSGASPETRVVSVERDPQRAQQARENLEDSDVEVIDGGCDQLRERGPFSLLYMNRATAELVERDLAWSLVEPGGLVVIDDFEPSGQWSTREPQGLLTDRLLHGWLTDERFTSTETTLAADLSVLIAARR